MPESESAPHNAMVEAKLFAPGRKRVLTLDGGGVRGIVTIAFLKVMERRLREATGRKDLVLADVFDMIAGTSVGSMLATMLALGKDTDEIERVFLEIAPKIFTGRPTILGPKRFDARPLVNAVRSIVKEETLGSDKLRTGLTIIAKRVDTGSVWALCNNPRMPYFPDGPEWHGNWRYKLETIIRASTAAPFLFTPTKITIGTDKDGKEDIGWFVDGAVSPHNNPSMQLLMMAALPCYKLGWTLSPDDLLMISVGTGQFRTLVNPEQRVRWGMIAGAVLPRSVRDDIEEAAFASQTLQGIISDNGLNVLKVMQAVSHPRFAWRINGEVKDLSGECLLDAVRLMAGSAQGQGLLRFQRYDLPLEPRLVAERYDVATAQSERAKLQALDDPGVVEPLRRLAAEVAEKQVAIEDFAGFLPA